MNRYRSNHLDNAIKVKFYRFMLRALKMRDMYAASLTRQPYLLVGSKRST